jgi:hypothetical protein
MFGPGPRLGYPLTWCENKIIVMMMITTTTTVMLVSSWAILYFLGGHNFLTVVLNVMNIA